VLKRLLVAGLLTAFLSATGITAASAKPANPGSQQSRLVKAQPGPTPQGQTAVYVADVMTGDTKFVGFQTPRSKVLITGPSNPPSIGQFTLLASVPYAQYGFSGTGTKTGTWNNRNGADSGNWHGYYKWTYQGSSHTSVRMDPHARVLLSTPATITSVTITS
jgi:hypothetical protein